MGAPRWTAALVGLAVSGGCTGPNPAFYPQGRTGRRSTDGAVGNDGSNLVEAAGPPVLMVGGASPLAWHGGAGGTLQPEDRCPAGQVAIGHQGAISDEGPYVGRVQMLCGSLRVTATAAPYPVEVTREAFLTARGKATGVPWTAFCPDGEVVVGYSGQAGSFLESLGTHCAPLEVAADRSEVRIGAIRDLAAHGSGTSPAFQDHCHRLGQVLVGADTRTGGRLDAIRPVCATITVVR